jgi:hypothetical protein
MTGTTNWMKLYSDHIKQSIDSLPEGYHETKAKADHNEAVPESDEEEQFDMDNSESDSDSD